MRYRKGNLYIEENISKYDFIGFTANSVINKQGELVMGAGNAKACKMYYSGIEVVFGAKIGHLSEYNVATSKHYGVFALQTKINWRDKSDISLVIRSINKLNDFAKYYPEKKIACPFPGISHGGLSRGDLTEYIEELPNNIDIWEY